MSDGEADDTLLTPADDILTHLDNNPNIRVWSGSECAFYLGVLTGEVRRQMAIADDITAPPVIHALDRLARLTPQIVERLRSLGDPAYVPRYPPTRARPTRPSV